MTAHELEEAWPRIRDELRRAVSPATFAIWIQPLEPRGLEGDTLVLTAPDSIRPWVADRFGRVLQSCAAAVLGPHIVVELSDGLAPPPRAPGAAPRPLAPANAVRPGETEGSLNPKLTFEQFVIGDSNRLAHAASLAVAEMPGQAYNPLFIYGEPGLGKTHLLHSVANYARTYGNGLVVRYVTVEAFTNQFVAALQSGSIDAFKARFRHNDILLVDDVQFLESKVKTEEEFFHTFNALYDMGSQLVLTSDRLPADLGALEDRLRERFASGLVTDVRAPDRETRLTILRKRAAHDGIAVAGLDALEVIADRLTDNIRALEGALIRIVAFASLTGRPVDAALAAEVLDGLYKRTAGKPARRTLGDIQAATCAVFDIEPSELVSASRQVRVSWPRQIAMYLSRELTDQTLPAIGRAFGRDHTTVMHACKRTAERMSCDPVAYETVRDLTERLQRPL